MTDRAVRFVCVVLVVAALIGGVGTTAQGASAQTTDTIVGTQIAPDDVSMQVALTEDGSAAWAVEYRVRLDDENATEAFESLQSDIEANESAYTSQFRERMESTAATAENATGREMTIADVSVATSTQTLGQEYGVVTYTFVWTNFAVVEDGEIRAGDALAGLFLDEETSLQFSWPDGYALDTVQPEPDDTRLNSRIVVWNGPLDFGANEPTVLVTEAPPAGDSTTTGADDAGDGSSESSDVNGLILGALGLLIVGGAVGWLLYRRRERAGVGPGGDPSADVSTTSGAGPAATTGDDGSASSAATGGGTDETAGDGSDGSPTGGSATGEGAAGVAAADETGAGGAPPWEDELLSNEERVLALVEHEGGRMKQQEVAQTLDWTDAKTSQVIRKMRDEDKLDAFRLGRENVLVLPGESLEPGRDDEE
ncbi:helix-turn-helix transcriptional regulator [Halobellus captivus]|uniref:helix-turn-helix transcriptional regulator n=1 Tax=Halobellus captivus TaxID=2592614 RepID=UPI0011A1C607|nr:hypothetical protein [Halobellus captivus]